MWTKQQYELLDFGNGRRLERFGRLVIDRPCPAATDPRPTLPKAKWAKADARFDRDEEGQAGRWIWKEQPLPAWTVDYGPFQLELKPSPVGQLGVFPEQAANWDWIARQVTASPRRLKVLNLFSYTGGSTLAAAAAGAEVTHIDAAKNMVAQARRNAELSGLAEAPIRWIPEDAVKFVRREIKRGNRYDAVILDPPSYGHGARGEVWRLSKHLPRLLSLCIELTAERPAFLLLTCHTPGYESPKLAELIRGALGQAADQGKISPFEVSLKTESSRALQSGSAVRFRAAR